jgi:hypothetical protein
MLYAHEIADKSFIMLQAHWLAERACQLVEHLKATHVIIHRYGLYYLYTRAEALSLLRSADDQATVERALNLHEYKRTPTADAYADAEQVPDRAVVMDAEDVIGFYDVTVPPSDLRGIRGLEKVVYGPEEAAEPVPRSLVTEFPEKVPLEKTASLLVYLTGEQELEEPEAEAEPKLLIAVPLGAAVDVIVQARRGFETVGDSEKRITVVDAGETLPVKFKLKATDLGPGRVRVLAFYDGQPLGAIKLAPLVVPAEEMATGKPAAREQEIAPIRVHQPDLRLVIEEREAGDNLELLLRLTAPNEGLLFQPFGPKQIRRRPAEFFDAFFRDIDTLPVGTADERVIAEKKLEAQGAWLFGQLFPQDLQVLLWSLRKRIKTVQILSDEPWIPWELCRLQGKEGGRVVEGPFMCEAFSVTRWRPGSAPPPTLTLNKMALVVPKGSRLTHAPDERDYVLSLADGGRQVERIPAKFLELRSSMAGGEYDGWHFTGHGSFRGSMPNRSGMVLEDREELAPQDLSGVVENVGIPKPLVFLNACESGRSEIALTDIGGFAARFLKVGAGAFIGAYWSIFDRSAFDFAQAFYRRLLAGLPIGQAVQEARLEIRPQGDPTWLAYTVFADPLATVQ